MIKREKERSRHSSNHHNRPSVHFDLVVVGQLSQNQGKIGLEKQQQIAVFNISGSEKKQLMRLTGEQVAFREIGIFGNYNPVFFHAFLSNIEVRHLLSRTQRVDMNSVEPFRQKETAKRFRQLFIHEELHAAD